MTVINPTCNQSSDNGLWSLSYDACPEDQSNELQHIEPARRTRRVASKIDSDLTEVFERFLKARQRASDPKPLRPKTVRSYSQAEAAFHEALTNPKDQEFLEEAIRRIIEERLASGEIGRTGMNVYIRGLNSFFSWCHELGFLQNRIKIKVLSVDRRKRPRTLTTEEVSIWLEFNWVTFSQRRVKFMVILVLDTGIRVEECLALRESDIDWSGSRLWVDQGKGGANREVPLSDAGKKALRQFLALTSRCRSTDSEGSCPIFCTTAGGQMNYRNALRDLKKIGKRMGTPWVGWHSFRRTFGTQYLQNRGLLTNLQQIYGHADVRTTILYLGNGIDEIVAMHDQHSPVSGSRRKCREHRGVRSPRVVQRMY